MAVTVDDVVDYIGADAAARWTDDAGATYPQISLALITEYAQQLTRVTYPPYDAPDLDEALKRRVQRNLVMRALPLSIDLGGEQPVRIGGRDAETTRLEAPYRKRTVG